MAISYVGGQVGGRAGATSTTTVTYALTGGSDATPQAGDFVVVTMGVGSAGRNTAQAVTAPGTWSNLGQLNPNTQTYDTAMNVSYKFMPATPDTTLTAPSTGSAQDAQNWTIQVFRGVDPTNPWDVAAVAASAVGSGRPNPGSITPVTAGAWVVICGAGAAATGAAYTAPANFTTNFRTRTQADTNDAMIGSGYWTGWTSGAVDPAQYTGGTANAVDSWAAYTLALRPVSSDITLALTGEQVAAQAGTVTKSNTGNVTLAGSQVIASAGDITAEVPGTNPVLISTTTFVLGTSQNPGAQSITVPADAQIVVVHSRCYSGSGSDLSLTSDFAGTFSILNDTGGGNERTAVAHAVVSSTGSKTITPSWSAAPVEGPLFFVSFIKNVNVSDYFRDYDALAFDSSGSAVTLTVDSAINDLVLALDSQYHASQAIPSAASGWTSQATQGNNSEGGRLSTANTPGASTTSFTGTSTSYNGVSIISIKPGAASPDITLPISGTQVAATAGSLTTSQQVSKTLTGAQVSADIGVLSKQVSVALTGDQVVAQAGVVTPSQQVSKALTGTQVTSQAGSLTANQQVTKTLTGEQVSALAGTVTPSQSTGNVDVALTGAQVAAQAGSLTASQQVTKALTGAQVAASAGSVTASQQVSKALTGEQVAASAGSVGKQISLALTGVQVAASAGTVTPSQQVSKALTGAQVAAQAGTVGVTQSSNDVTVTLTGAQVAASAGTVTPSQAVTKALTGAQVAASAGSVTTSQLVSLALTGAQAAADAGTLTASQQVTKALTGAQVAAQAGTVGKQITIALTGAQVNAGAGTITTTQTSFVALTGAQVTAEAGVLAGGQSKSVALTGAQVAAQAGTVGKQFELFRALTGAEVTAQAGTVTSSQNITIALTGAQATAEAGTLTTAQAVSKALTGAQVSVQAGSLTAQREFFATLFGSQVAAQVGSLTTSQALTRALIGSQVQVHGGIVDAGASLSLSVNIPLQGARVVALAGQFANTGGQCGYSRGRVVNE